MKHQLFHGTPFSNLDSILKDGIRPRGRKKSVWKATSNPKAVYLSSAMPSYYAVAHSDLSQGVVFEVDFDQLNPTLLAPDEDFLEQVTRKTDDLPKTWTMEKRTAFYKKRILWNHHLYNESIQNLGTCAYFDTIKPTALKRYMVFDTSKMNPTLVMAILDTSAGLMGHRFMGAYRKALTDYLFGSEIDPMSLFTHAPLDENREQIVAMYKTIDPNFEQRLAHFKEELDKRSGIEVFNL